MTDPALLWGVPLLALSLLGLIASLVLGLFRFRQWRREVASRAPSIELDEPRELSAHARRVQRAAARRVELVERVDGRTRAGKVRKAIAVVLGDVPPPTPELPKVDEK